MSREIGESEGERKVLADIATYGWHCLSIHPDDEGPGYSFTIGLFKTYGHPELIIFGLAPGVSHQILAIAAEAAKSGAPIDLSVPSDALLNDYDCCFVEVDKSEYRGHVGYARWYYGGNEFPLYQIVWPSRDGSYPWDEGATAEFRETQPVISSPSRGA